MAHGSSPFDLGSCAKQCASAHRSGYECFQTLTNFTQAELVKAFNANEKMLEGLFPDALTLDVFKQARAPSPVPGPAAWQTEGPPGT